MRDPGPRSNRTPGDPGNTQMGLDGGSTAAEQHVQIESVFGLSTPCAGTLALCPAPTAQQHLAAFPAGSCVVVYDTAARRQISVLRSQATSRPVAVVAWSPDGSHLVAGEAAGAGGAATVHIWNAESGACTQQLRGQHRHGVGSLCFSPDGARGATAEARNWDARGVRMFAHSAHTPASPPSLGQLGPEKLLLLAHSQCRQAAGEHGRLP
jgi:WD40 repeat protein